MEVLALEKMGSIKGGEKWPSGTLCFFAPAGWISSRGKTAAGFWNVVARECWNS